MDFCAGREFNPYLAGDLKLLTFRASMIGLAALNVFLLLQSINTTKGQVNLAVAFTAAFQVFYAADALFHEETYFFSYDAMNTGYGYSLVSNYFSFPFLPTLITRYVIEKS